MKGSNRFSLNTDVTECCSSSFSSFFTNNSINKATWRLLLRIIEQKCILMLFITFFETLDYSMHHPFLSRSQESFGLTRLDVKNHGFMFDKSCIDKTSLVSPFSFWKRTTFKIVSSRLWISGRDPFIGRHSSIHHRHISFHPNRRKTNGKIEKKIWKLIF